MARTIYADGISLKGEREKNQDNFIIDPDKSLEIRELTDDKTRVLKEIDCYNEIHVVAICDGVGGEYFGEVAAIKTLKTIKETVEERRYQNVDIEDLIHSAVKTANERVVEFGRFILGSTPATTLAIIIWKGNQYWITSIGDSSVFLFRRKKLAKLTEDDAIIKDYGSGEKQRQLSSYIGWNSSSKDLKVDIIRGVFNNEDRFLICTDGLTDVLKKNDITECITGDKKEIINSFQKKLRNTTLLDNCTFVIIDVGRLRTQLANVELENCEDEKEYRDLYNDNKKYFNNWETFVKGKIKEKKLTQDIIAKYCGCDRKTINAAVNSIPGNRNMVVMLGIIFEMNLDQVNAMLRDYALMGELYPKDLYDATWIWIIEHGAWTSDRGSIAKTYRECYIELTKNVNKKSPRSTSQKRLKTSLVLKDLRAVKNLEDASRRMNEWTSGRYNDLISLINELMKKTDKNIPGFYYNSNSEAKMQMYYRQMELLKKGVGQPEREFIIALGVQLELTRDGINKLLDTAKMRSVYSMENTENYIFYLLDELYMKRPDLFAELNEETDQLDADIKFAADVSGVAEYVYAKMKEKKDLEKFNSYKNFMKYF